MSTSPIVTAEEFLAKLVDSPTAKALLKLIMAAADDALHASALTDVAAIALQALQAGLSGESLVKLIEQAMTDASDAQMKIELGPNT